MRFLFPIIACSVACKPLAVVETSQQDLTAPRISAEGTVEAVSVVRFLNHPDTTAVLLDDEVHLDKRAALGLTAHRDGPDGLFGTHDDNLFDTIVEVDAAYWVGPAAIDALLQYVEIQGLILQGDDHLGTWDGVAFTVTEAEITVALANVASESQLDHDIGLDNRAVDSILQHRPVESVAHLAGLYYVGNAGLTALKTHAAPDLTPSEFAADTAAGLGLEFMTLDIANERALEQEGYGGEIDFETAFVIGLDSFTTDDSNAESPLEVVLAETWPDDPYPMLIEHMNRPGTTLHLLGPADHVEEMEEVSDHWILRLDIPSWSDHAYWAVVPRNGDAPYNYGFN
jgi:hypothetical protein